jgi:membrane protease YdiL (CAAX protease family)
MLSKYHFVPDINTGFLTDEDTKKYISRLAFSIFVFEVISFVLAYALAGLVVAVIGMFAPALLNSADIVAILNNVISISAAYCVGLPLLCMLSSPLPKAKPYKEKLGFGKWLGGLCVCIFAMSFGSSASNVVIIFIESLSGNMMTNPVAEMVGQSNIWIDIVFTAILVPILEELLFRKILCDRLLPLGEGYAIFISATIFGLTHGNLFQFFYAFAVGIIFGLIYVKTGRVIYTMLYHILLNFSGGVVVTLVTRGIDFDGLNNLLYDMESGTATEEQMMIFVDQLTPLLIYELVIGALSLIGIVLLVHAVKKKEIRLEAGILPPPKKHRISNIFCTVGTAALITAYVFFFVWSMLPQ